MNPPKSSTPKLVALAFALAAYISAYAVMSAGGKYKSDVYGLRQGEDGKAYLAEKLAFSKWQPFETYDLKGTPTAKSIIFYPLIWLDRKLVHNTP